MAGEHVPHKYKYKLAVSQDTRLELRAAEMRGNAVKITAWLLSRPPGQRLRREPLGKAEHVELRTEVPGPLHLDWRPRLSIWYRIDNILDDIEDYSAECEFTAEGTGLQLLPRDDAEAVVAGTIHGTSFQITGTFSSLWRPVVAYVDLVEGGAS